MVDSSFSEFIMAEKAPYKLPDPQALTSFLMNGIKQEEAIYGPVFTTRFIQHSLSFMAEKIGEDLPKDIKNLDKLLEYLVSKSDKYPTPYSVVPYAQSKTENEFQGQTGAGTRMETIALSRNVAERTNIEDKKFDLDEILIKFGQTLSAMRVGPREWGYKKNDYGSVDILYPDCPLMDGCKRAFDEGLLKRPDGRLRCGVTNFVCGYLKISTGYEWDYDLLKYYNPYCIVRCFIL